MTAQPITADDVIWSFDVLKANSPKYNRYYANVTEAVAIRDREVEFRFDQKGNRELPHIIGDLAVLPKHWWEGTDASGKKRDITQPTLEPPLGSGAYKIESFKPGSEIIWTRVPDYWGGRRCQQCRPQQFRPPPLRLHPGRQRRVAGLHQGRLSRTSGRRTVRGAGRRTTISRPSRPAT